MKTALRHHQRIEGWGLRKGQLPGILAMAIRRNAPGKQSFEM